MLIARVKELKVTMIIHRANHRALLHTSALHFRAMYSLKDKNQSYTD
jgi:hypothetical protein